MHCCTPAAGTPPPATAGEEEERRKAAKKKTADDAHRSAVYLLREAGDIRRKTTFHSVLSLCSEAYQGALPPGWDAAGAAAAALRLITAAPASISSSRRCSQII